jgi:hypothetical protein
VVRRKNRAISGSILWIVGLLLFQSKMTAGAIKVDAGLPRYVQSYDTPNGACRHFLTVTCGSREFVGISFLVQGHCIVLEQSIVKCRVVSHVMTIFHL